MLEGRIDSSDLSHLYVTSAHGQRYAVSRSDVVGIDHPGTALIVLGTAGTVLGGALMFAARSKSGGGSDSNDKLNLGAAGLAMTAVVVLAASIPSLIVGGYQYHRSVHAARPVEYLPGMQASALLPRLTCAFCAAAGHDSHRPMAPTEGRVRLH